MSFTLSELITGAIKYQGTDAFDIRTATGGSTTSFIDTTLEDRYGDDELKDGSLVVMSGTAEKQFSRISAYVEGTNTATLDTTLTDGISTGNSCMLIPADYPLRTIIELANSCLFDYGYIVGTATQITILADTTEYDLNILTSMDGIVSEVYLQTNAVTDDNRWEKIYGWRVEHHATPTSAPTLILDRQYTAGYVLYVVVSKTHARVTAYNSQINQQVHPQLITLMLADKLMQWHGVTDANINYANKIQAELAEAKRMYRPIRPPAPSKFLKWGDS